MAIFSLWLLDESQITISGGEELSGYTQGDASHLDGLTITFNSTDWTETTIRDNDSYFTDNRGNSNGRDADQRLDEPVTINGETYSRNARIEAEYEITLQDPDGNLYVFVGYNINEDDNPYPSYGTVEGLVFLGPGEFPPTGVPLTVVSTDEGPRGTATPYAGYYVPACFTPGTLIETPQGPRPVEELQAGDTVLTRDCGPQILDWVGQVRVGARRLSAEPAFVPILIERDALGLGRPNRDMHLSPQHRVMLSDWRAELMFGAGQVLVAAAHLVNGRTIRRDLTVKSLTYIHLFCASHQILIADGLEAESFRPGPQVLATLPSEARDELLGLFPELSEVDDDSPMPACRQMLKRWETALIRAA